ncbi:hypothetical protein [Sphingomonas sp. 28-63-12]|uniref:hypothetical protein n=1 Tax=Sphingomonas sp. 28-63-12 TaxID=1970434 RepID=UPI0035A95923
MLIAVPAAAPDQQPKLDYSIGPVDRTFGATTWAVHACSDQQSVVVVNKEGNPAGPLVFILSRENGHYRIDGEGTGSKSASDAALADLRPFDDVGIAALGDAARAIGH